MEELTKNNKPRLDQIEEWNQSNIYIIICL